MKRTCSSGGGGLSMASLETYCPTLEGFPVTKPPLHPVSVPSLHSSPRGAMAKGWMR